MIVKKLREKNNWSQEHLSMISGLSLRTIQRVEAGNAASLETLKSLASIFEIEISKLKEGVTVIDKETEKWQKAPWWVTSAFWGIKTRKTALILERVFFTVGLLGLAAAIFEPKFAMLNVAWCSAYWQAIVIRWIDNENLW